MKFYNTYYICSSTIDSLKSLRFSLDEAGNAYYIENWNKYKSALVILLKLPFLTSLVNEIYETVPVFVHEKDRPTIFVSTYTNLDSTNKLLIEKVSTIIDLYESMSLPNCKNGIDVKIPDCDSLKEYIYYLKELDFIFSQCPFLQSDTETLKFSSVDIGSNWINFLITVSGGTAVSFYILNHLAIILDKAITLKSHLITLKQQEEVLEEIKKKNKLAESEIEMFEVLKKHYMETAITELEAEIKPLENGEEVGKAEKSLEKLCTLLDKGVEIYASLDAPKEVQNLFPDFEETPKLTADLVKFIEEKNSGGE